MTTVDKTGASDAEFQARVAPFERIAPFENDAADVQRGLAEAIDRGHVLARARDSYWATSEIAAALLPTVQRLIADAEKRGYERGRRDFQFAPEGDNHHNAALCPYCSPESAL